MNKLFVSEPQLLGNEERYILDCVRTGMLSMGTYVRAFEDFFASYCGVKHAVSAMNGTAALHLSMLALGVRPGDEVIVPALTYVATANAVSYCGATPVFCDVDRETWCMDPVDAVRRITPRTVGILPVHLYGHPAHMDLLSKICREYKLWMVEDAAEAHGALYRGRMVGQFGQAGVFSFYGNKIVTCGEGGMVTTNDDEIASQLRLYRGQGVDISIHRYHHSVVGYNYRMTNLQAAIGLGQMECIPDKLAKRKEIAYHYRLRFMDHDDGIEMQAHRPHVEHANWMFSILVPLGVDRDVVMHRLDAHGIETRPVFRCMHHLPMYAGDDVYFTAEEISDRGINLPTHAGMTLEDVDRVVNKVVNAIR